MLSKKYRLLTFVVFVVLIQKNEFDEALLFVVHIIGNYYAAGLALEKIVLKFAKETCSIQDT